MQGSAETGSHQSRQSQAGVVKLPSSATLRPNAGTAATVWVGSRFGRPRIRSPYASLGRGDAVWCGSDPATATSPLVCCPMVLPREVAVLPCLVRDRTEGYEAACQIGF